MSLPQSHEIRTPMNAVLGVGRLLSDTPLSLEQQQLVAMITNSGQLLLTIINDILDYSKIEVRQRHTLLARTGTRAQAHSSTRARTHSTHGPDATPRGLPSLRCSPFVFFGSMRFVRGIAVFSDRPGS